MNTHEIDSKNIPEKSFDAYKQISSICLRRTELFIGYDPSDATYMTCHCAQDFLGNMNYERSVASKDYLRILKLFTERIEHQIHLIEFDRRMLHSNLEVLDTSHCRTRAENESLEGKLIIICPESLAPEYRLANYQLGFATGGFGCAPNARGRSVSFQELHSGEKCRWVVTDVLGIADTNKLPDWAKEKLAEHEKKRITPEKDRGNER